MYFFLHKSWIWRTLGQVVKKFSYCPFHNASKECFWPKKFLNFMPRFKSAILAIFQFCQNGTFELVHEIRKFFWPKTFYWSIMKMAIRKFFHNLSQGLPNPGFMQKKVQKGNFLKEDLRELIFFVCFRFLWISDFLECLCRFVWQFLSWSLCQFLSAFLMIWGEILWMIFKEVLWTIFYDFQSFKIWVPSMWFLLEV